VKCEKKEIGNRKKERGKREKGKANGKWQMVNGVGRDCHPADIK